MPVTLRLSREEQKLTEEKCKEINRELVRLNMETVKKSELLHFVITEGLKRLRVNKDEKLELM